MMEGGGNLVGSFVSSSSAGGGGNGGDVYYDAREYSYQNGMAGGGGPMGMGAPSNNMGDYDANRTDILKLILYDLNSAIAPRDIRLLAVHAALEEFDHDDEVLHDEELELRADHILLQKLTYAMSIAPGSIEVGYIASAMECVYRGSRSRLATSFHEVSDALLPLFVEMIRPPPGWSSLAISASFREGMEESVTDSAPVSRSTADEDLLQHHNVSPDSQGDSGRMDYGESTQRTYYGDYDEESAESVEIPSGTGEYYAQMNRMGGEGGTEQGGPPGAMGGAGSEGGGVGSDAARAMGMGASVPPNIPAGTGEYFEEMKRRTSADAGDAAGTRGQGAGETAIVPSPGGVTAVGEGAIVLHHRQSSVSSVGALPPLDALPPPPPIQPPPGPLPSEAAMGSGMAATATATSAAPPHEGVQSSSDTIRMELDDAMEAMKKQTMSGEAQQRPPQPLPEGASRRLSLEAPPPPQVAPSGGKPVNRLSIESMVTEQFDNTERAHVAFQGRALGDGSGAGGNGDRDDAMELRGGGRGFRSDDVDVDDDDIGVMQIRGGGHDDGSSYNGAGSSNYDDGGEGKYDDDDEEDDYPNFHPSAFHSEFNDLVRGMSGDDNGTEGGEGGGAEGGGMRSSTHSGTGASSAYESAYEESQDNPFSDTSSFYGNRSGTAQSFRGYGGGSSVYSQEYAASGVPEEYDDGDGGDEGASTHNPFSDTSSFRGHGNGGYGGSSVFSGSYTSGAGSGRAGGSNLGRSVNSRGDESYGGNSSNFPPKIDEYSESEAGGHPHGDDYDDDDDGASPAAAAAPAFDEQGGFSGGAPAVFSGFDDEEDEPSHSVNSESKAAGDHPSQSSAGYHSTASGPHYDEGGAMGSYPGGSSAYDDYTEQDPRYGEEGQTYQIPTDDGFGGGGGGRKFSEVSGFTSADFASATEDGTDVRRQSDITDEWGESDRDPTMMMEPPPPPPPQASGGGNLYMSQQSTGTSGMDSMGQSTMMSDFGQSAMMSELEQHLPSTDPYSADPATKIREYLIDEDYDEDDGVEEKYSDFPYDNDRGGAGAPPPRGGGPIAGHEEDIFHFQEPRLSMASQDDYFNYSDPVEGEICPLAVRKVLKILRYFSRVLSAMEPLAQQTGLVDALLYHMTKKPLSVDYDDEIASRVDAIAVVVNLACAEENKIMLVCGASSFECCCVLR